MTTVNSINKNLLENCYKYNDNFCNDYNYIYFENIIYRTVILIIIIKFIIKTITKFLKSICIYYDKIKTFIRIQYNNLKYNNFKYIDFEYVILILLGSVLFLV